MLDMRVTGIEDMRNDYLQKDTVLFINDPALGSLEDKVYPLTS